MPWVTQGAQVQKGVQARFLHHIRRIRRLAKEAPRQPERPRLVAHKQ
jgi:hypothetical protein